MSDVAKQNGQKAAVSDLIGAVGVKMAWTKVHQADQSVMSAQRKVEVKHALVNHQLDKATIALQKDGLSPALLEVVQELAALLASELSEPGEENETEPTVPPEPLGELAPPVDGTPQAGPQGAAPPPAKKDDMSTGDLAAGGGMKSPAQGNGMPPHKKPEQKADPQPPTPDAPPGGIDPNVPENKATWDTAKIDGLPDSSFLYVEPGGTKDAESKTTPRSLRHFPVKDESGTVDLAHVRDALSRIQQSSVPQEAKDKATAEANSMLAAAQKAATPPGPYATKAETAKAAVDPWWLKTGKPQKPKGPEPRPLKW